MIVSVWTKPALKDESRECNRVSLAMERILSSLR
jgi:hypothetical protein